MMPFPPGYPAGAHLLREEKPKLKCAWDKCFQSHQATKWATDQYSGYCSLYCREEYFSSIGGGDSRGADPNRMTFEELKYIRSRPSPA